MKSTRWRNQELVHYQLQMGSLNVRTRSQALKHTVKILTNLPTLVFEDVLTCISVVICSSCSCGCSNVYESLVLASWLQGRAGRSASTARPTRTQSVDSAPAVCAVGSRMLTCSCCAMSATWRSTSTASTHLWPPSQTMRTGEKKREKVKV